MVEGNNIAVKAGWNLVCPRCELRIGYWSTDQYRGHKATVAGFISDFPFYPHSKMECPSCKAELNSPEQSKKFHNVLLGGLGFLYFEKENNNVTKL